MASDSHMETAIQGGHCKDLACDVKGFLVLANVFINSRKRNVICPYH